MRRFLGGVAGWMVIVFDVKIRESIWEESVFLTPAEEKCFRSFFQALAKNISLIMESKAGVPEESLTHYLIHAINGVDSTAKSNLVRKLRGISELKVEMQATEYPGRGRTKGEALDIIIDLDVHNGRDTEHIRRAIILEAKRLYSDENGYSRLSRFKELNKLEGDVQRV